MTVEQATDTFVVNSVVLLRIISTKVVATSSRISFFYVIFFSVDHLGNGRCSTDNSWKEFNRTKKETEHMRRAILECEQCGYHCLLRDHPRGVQGPKLMLRALAIKVCMRRVLKYIIYLLEGYSKTPPAFRSVLLHFCCISLNEV